MKKKFLLLAGACACGFLVTSVNYAVASEYYEGRAVIAEILGMDPGNVERSDVDEIIAAVDKAVNAMYNGIQSFEIYPNSSPYIDAVHDKSKGLSDVKAEVTKYETYLLGAGNYKVDIDVVVGGREFRIIATRGDEGEINVATAVMDELIEYEHSIVLAAFGDEGETPAVGEHEEDDVYTGLTDVDAARKDNEEDDFEPPQKGDGFWEDDSDYVDTGIDYDYGENGGEDGDSGADDGSDDSDDLGGGESGYEGEDGGLE